MQESNISHMAVLLQDVATLATQQGLFLQRNIDKLQCSLEEGSRVSRLR